MPSSTIAMIADVAASTAPAALAAGAQSPVLVPAGSAAQILSPLAADPHHGCVDWFSYWTGFGARAVTTENVDLVSESLRGVP